MQKESVNMKFPVDYLQSKKHLQSFISSLTLKILSNDLEKNKKEHTANKICGLLTTIAYYPSFQNSMI